jgi:hypothetical protein
MGDAVTEDEAKTKWCPMTRQAANNGIAFSNKPDNHASMVNCIGSACMAWRRLETDPNKPLPIEERMTAGYCGLAGKP